MNKKRIVLFVILAVFLSLVLSTAAEPMTDREELQEEDISVSVVLSPEVLPEGGGQTASITVTVIDKDGKPLEGAKAVFHASCFEFANRDAQLSQPEMITDASGKARVTYTSLAADDKKMVHINVAVYNMDPAIEEFRHYKIVAADRTAVVCGLVSDPYTGAPMEGIHIHFMTGDSESIGFAETDKQGRYRVPVPTGTYQMNFQMPIIDQITVKASNPGQTYTIDNKKGILKGVVSGVSPGRTVMALAPPDYSPTLDAWTLQAEIQSDGSFILALAPKTYELFIVGRDTPFITGVTVQSGRVNDIGTVNAR